MFGRPTSGESYFIAIFLQGFLYGIYSGILALYLQCHASARDESESKKTRNVIFCCICVLYALSTAVFASDISGLLNVLLRKPVDTIFRINVIEPTLFACCDCIAQFILIYRCWIVWGRNIRVVIIPSVLTCAFMATWLASADSQYIDSDQFLSPGWVNPMFFSSLTLSLVVNALATGLIVFRILKVFREVKASLSNQILGTTGGSKLRHIIFILIESGMALFSIQLARLVDNTVMTTDGVGTRSLQIIIGLHKMITGIAPTVILVRTSMGLSFGKEKSMEEFAIESLRFMSNDPNPLPGTGSIGIGGQDSRNDDGIDIQQNNDIGEMEG